MAGSSFGTIFRITTWGESHGKALGVVIDGCPAGLSLCEEDIQIYLDRRKPGSSKIATPRKEDDKVEILSGVFEGKTTGCPISLIIYNTSQRSSDYGEIAVSYRPGHADYTFDEKYGFRDYRGGGRSSGRETAGRVAAGSIAIKLLKEMGITVEAYTRSIGPITISEDVYDRDYMLTSPTAMPDKEACKKAMEYLDSIREKQDSAGGVMECRITGVPAGIGDPVFEKLDANLSKAVMSIGAVKAVEIGDGCKVATSNGSMNNDRFVANSDGSVSKKTNHAGGILGGISDGSEIKVTAYVKPTPSIFQNQETINKDHENINLSIKGRHDPIIVPRAVVVMECMCALTLLDSMMINMSAKLDSMIDFYTK